MSAGTSPFPIKAFCPGQAKSGTASLAGLLANYRAAHEPDRPATLDLVRRVETLPDEAVRTALLERDHRLQLEYDVAWANQFFLPHLVSVFPSARFVVLVRDCYTWAESIIGHVITREIPVEVAEFLAWWFRPDRFPARPQDAGLKERGMFPLAAYLAAWNRHIDLCMEVIPPDRRLVLRTHELARSHERLAAFLALPVESLATDQGHRNRSTWREGIRSVVDLDYLDDLVQEICGDNMARFFPGMTGHADVPDLWAGGAARSEG